MRREKLIEKIIKLKQKDDLKDRLYRLKIKEIGYDWGEFFDKFQNSIG